MIDLKKQANLIAAGFYLCIVALELVYLLIISHQWLLLVFSLIHVSLMLSVLALIKRFAQINASVLI